ncbi:hypothetical protein FEM48_Zijuj03G0158100 [Ziziphus jujuba var. spinosa]|uniref:Uncharacterized protein n=1 Tax=Ziziphus jujuba var. spinosa TaxID=714518 RepID=A0A978VR75_ZIZJJ|nr:hypothetical protein FEM48_Zijuj03G0158100 [Ziziphus jujuba var. spinosa]
MYSFHLVEELLMKIKQTEAEVARWREACELEVEARKPAEKSLQLADNTAAWLCKLVEELSKQLEEAESRNQNRCKALRMVRSPFAIGESSNTHNQAHHQNLKLPFLRFDWEDPSGWIYKAE